MDTSYQVARSKATARSTKYYEKWKRLIDLALSLVGLVLAAPLFAMIAVLVKLESPGPILFIQTRIGKNGRPFRILKFRTLQCGLDETYHEQFMRAFVRGEVGKSTASDGQNNLGEPNPTSTPRRSTKFLVEDGSSVFKPFQKSHVTRIGRILRKSSLDELPQLINILAGDMSLVGPRPNVPWEVEEYQSWHRERLSVLPGLTGLAQVNGRSGISFDMIAKYDIEYVRNRSLWLDLRILVATVLSLIDGRGTK